MMMRISTVVLLSVALVACDNRTKRAEQGPKATEESQALLLAAINDKNIDGVRSAIAAGASVKRLLPAEGEAPATWPLARAILKDDFATARYLLSLGADPNVRNSPTDPPAFVRAIYSSSPALIELLLDSGAAADSRFGPGLGMTALAEAARVPRSPAIHALVRRGADPNGWVQEIEDDGRLGERRTPLMLAAGVGNYSAVLQLLEVGADPRVVNESGRRAVDFVLDFGRPIKLALSRPEQYRSTR